MNTAKKNDPSPVKMTRGSDWIHLRQIRVNCLLGVHPSERIRVRPVRIDLSLECDLSRAAESDQLEDTLNYELLEAEVVGLAKKCRYRLVEALAEDVAKIGLQHPQVHTVRVAVEKPGALPLTQSVVIEIERRK